jgi:hypothetical protein
LVGKANKFKRTTQQQHWFQLRTLGGTHNESD